MWHKANVQPSEYGFHPIWVKRQDTGYEFMTAGYWMHELQMWSDGHGHTMESNRWKVIAWFDVPIYKEH